MHMRVRFLDEDGDEYVIELADVEEFLSTLRNSRSIAFKHSWYHVGDIIQVEQEIIVSLIDKAVMGR